LTVAPAAPRLIDRGDLVAALDRAAARKVTIISAPAGSGKTSLLRAWAGHPGQPHRLAVLQVQRDQHDAQQFWLALLDAVRHAAGADSGAEPPAGTPGFNAPAMAGRVLSELAGARSSFTLVIDDLHELTSPEALAQLGRLLTDLPPQVHAILTTRHDVRLGLHQLRLAGELAEIRAADLRFSGRETRELLDASGIALSEAGVALLYQRTEGWAAGLRLAVISLAGHPDPERFVAEFSGSDRTVAEYLLAEMLDRQPPGVQDLLLRTALLDRVNGELADLLTGRPGSEQILLDLEDANAFTESLDPGRTWFRYHHLLADFLRLELRRTLPEEVPELHRRAAGWFTVQGQVAEAVRHTQAAGDWQDAARLLADHAFSLTLDGQAQTMQALVRAFPPGADHPELALVRAMGDLAQGRLDEAAAHLAVAGAHAGTAAAGRRRRLQVAVASLRLSLARRRGHLAGVIEQARFLASPVTGSPMRTSPWAATCTPGSCGCWRRPAGLASPAAAWTCLGSMTCLARGSTTEPGRAWRWRARVPGSSWSASATQRVRQSSGFSRYATQVTLLVRGRGLGAAMSQYLIDQVSVSSAAAGSRGQASPARVPEP
jgi:LuxR family transcriptional regulator, maltose regulon positive regulatory protein